MTQKFKRTMACLSAITITLSMAGAVQSEISGKVDCIISAAAETTAPTLIEPSKDANGVYQITKAEEFYWFANKVNNDNENFAGANAVLKNDITVNKNLLSSLTFDSDGDVRNGAEFISWTPIGTSISAYKGTFNGNGHKISGLFYQDTDNYYVGLFGYLSGEGKISNVIIEDSYFKGYHMVGSICAENRGTIENCKNSGEVCGDGKYSDVGGICGENNSVIKNCVNSGKIVVKDETSSAGGISGINNYNTTVENCKNSGDIISMGESNNSGGISGYVNESGKILNCENSGNITACGDYISVGGVCGYNYQGVITNCGNSGVINSKGDTLSIGGISGCNYFSTDINCVNAGKIIAIGQNSIVGGICGNKYYESPVENCYYLENCNEKGTNFTNTFGTSKTAVQFTNGEVAYLLSQGCTVGEGKDAKTYDGSLWGQKIGKDNSPVINGEKVYKVTSYAGCIKNPGKAGTGYSNTDTVVYASHQLKKVSAKAATCTKSGNYEYWICANEKGVYYKDKDGKGKFANLKATVINATGHKYVKVKTVNPTLTSQGYTLYRCSKCGATVKKNVVPALVSISKATVSGIKNTTYTGKQVKPAVKVVIGKTVLKNGKDYTVSYGTNKIGKATVKITGKGKYAGTVIKTFTILPRTTSISVKSTVKGKISAAIVKRSEATKYQIQLSSNSKFTGAKKVTVKSTKAALKGTSKKTYYVRVRTVNGKYVSGWSAVKKIKVK